MAGYSGIVDSPTIKILRRRTQSLRIAHVLVIRVPIDGEVVDLDTEVALRHRLEEGPAPQFASGHSDHEQMPGVLRPWQDDGQLKTRQASQLREISSGDLPAASDGFQATVGVGSCRGQTGRP